MAGFGPSTGSRKRGNTGSSDSLRGSPLSMSTTLSLATLSPDKKKENPFAPPPPIPLKEYVADGSELDDEDETILAYCASKSLDSMVEDQQVEWGSVVIGQDEGDGWLRCGGVFLPMTLEGVTVLAEQTFNMTLVPRKKPYQRKAPPAPPIVVDTTSSKASRTPPSPGAGVGDLVSPKSSAPSSARSSPAMSPARSLASETDARPKKPSVQFALDDDEEEDALRPGKQPSAQPDDDDDEDEGPALRNWSEDPNQVTELVREESSESEASEISLEERMPLESRLPALEPSHWLAPGGVRAPHRAPLRCCADDMQEAAMRGDVTLVRRLVEANVSVNAPIRAFSDEEFLTLLHVMACRPSIPNGTRILVELLRSRANPNVRSSLGSTPLIFACLHKNVGAVEVLLDVGATASPVDDHGRTAVRCAMIPDPDVPNSDVLAVELTELLAASGAPLDEGGSVAPIVEAVMQHNNQAVRTLIRLGATPDGLNEAVFNAPVTMIQDLIEAEANPFFRDATGKTIMEIALTRGEETVTTMLRDYIGDLERGNHPHLVTRTLLGSQEVADPRLYGGRSMNLESFDPGRMNKLAWKDRKSLADRIIEQHQAANRPATKADMYRVRLQQVAKKICRSYTFQSIMLFFLTLALFLPDVWIVFNLSSATPLDVMIVIIFLFFLLELALQCIGLQKNYLFKFAFWMDLLGAWSVPLDHSLVTDSIVGSFASMDGTTLARVTKLVKLGARAGRLSRLVKLLRFLPGMKDNQARRAGATHTDTHVGTATVMSKLINMRISLQVSGLIIAMVILLPILDIPRHPQDDYSMQAWVTLLDKTALEYPNDVMDMVESMQEFYNKLDYHAFEVYLAYGDGTNRTVTLQTTPARMQDVMIFSAGSDRTRVSFNFRGPNLAEAISSIVLIFLIIICMFTSAMIVSSGVSRIVLNPLEKLLNVVKDIAGTIFASVNNLARTVAKQSDQDSDDSEREEGNEAKMLERVLRKLTALSELTAKKSPFDDFDTIGVEDKATLRDYNIIACPESEPMGAEKLIGAAKDREHMNAVLQRVGPKILEAGVNWDSFNSWDFDVGSLNMLQREQLAMCLIQLYQLPSCEPQDDRPDSPIQPLDSSTDRDSPSPVSPGARPRRGSLSRRRSSASRRSSFVEENSITVGAFILALASGYADARSVPYHNFMHAMDVAFTLTRVLKMIHSEYFVSANDRLALVVAALAHDIGHGGYNNAFLVNSNDTLALIYNDRSPLEMMHCARLFEISTKPGCTIFANLESAAYREVRHVIVEAILATDTQKHFSMVTELNMAYDMRETLFESVADMADDAARLPPVEIVEVFASTENLWMLRRFLVHYCDLSNSFKTWNLCRFWGDRMLEELLNQRDREENLGMPLSCLHDRNTLNRPKAHLGIIEFCIAPLAVAARCLFPRLTLCEDNMLANYDRWWDAWMQTGPTDGEVERAMDRREVLRRREKKMTKETAKKK